MHVVLVPFLLESSSWGWQQRSHVNSGDTSWPAGWTGALVQRQQRYAHALRW